MLPLEDCRTVEDAAVILKRKLRLGLNTSLSLAAESTVPEISVDRNVGGASLLKGSALLSAGQQLKIMARLLLHVTFGNTTLGAPNVQVALRGSDEITTTDSAGVCELIVPAGRHHVLIDHGMSNEGSDEMEIDVSEVESRVEFSVPACLFVYLQAPDSEKGAAAPTNVPRFCSTLVGCLWRLLLNTMPHSSRFLRTGRGMALCESRASAIDSLAGRRNPPVVGSVGHPGGST